MPATGKPVPELRDFAGCPGPWQGIPGAQAYKDQAALCVDRRERSAVLQADPAVDSREEIEREKETDMHTGMLWFDNSQTQLNIKIQKAVDYYQKKYGRTPDLCLVHPSMLELSKGQMTLELSGLTVRPYRPVLPGHIWVGISDKE
jgi:hypothetical protein